MVFFEALPTEIWFKIYKMEHNSKLVDLNREIIKIKQRIDHINDTFIFHPLFRVSMVRFRWNEATIISYIKYVKSFK